MWYLLISLPLVSSHMIPVSLSSAWITAGHHTSSIVSTGPHKTSILIIGQYNLYNYYMSIWNWFGLVSNSCVLRPLCLYNDYQSAHSRCSHHQLHRSDEDCIGATKVLHYRRDGSNFTVASHWVSSFSAALANSSGNFDHTRCRRTNSLHRLVASTNLFAYWVYAAISWLSCMGWIGCSLKKVTDLLIRLAISTVIVSDSITEGLQTYIVSGVHLPPTQHTLQTPLLIIHRAHQAVCKH